MIKHDEAILGNVEILGSKINMCTGRVGGMLHYRWLASQLFKYTIELKPHETYET